MKRIFALLLCLLFLTGCTPKVAGYVTDKQFEKSHMEPYLRVESYPCGTYSNYNGTTTVTSTRYCTRSHHTYRWVPDYYALLVTDGSGETHTISVSKDDYDRFQINTYFDNTKQ